MNRKKPKRQENELLDYHLPALFVKTILLVDADVSNESQS